MDEKSDLKAEESNPESEEADPESEGEAEDVTEEEAEEQNTVRKLSEANRKSIEEMLMTEDVDRVISQLKRFRAADVKEMVRDEYPDMDLNGASAMDMTKKELLDCLRDFYKNERQEEV
ncbi:MAG: hypothetical protein ACI4D3_03690 [Lachnospiraceae bacterium]